MKEALCRAFCDALVVNEVPVGFAVKTAFESDGGDAITFYIVQGDSPDQWRVEDDGATVANLDMLGVDVIGSGPRAVAFEELVQEYKVRLDPDDAILHTSYVAKEELPRLALAFLALLLRIQDFALMTRERVEETFRHDVVSAIQERFGKRAVVEERYAFSEDLKDYSADIAIVPRDTQFPVTPLAVFIGTSELRALEAMLFYDRVTYVKPFECKVVLILDTVKTRKISGRTLNRVANHFPIAAFRDEPDAAMAHLERQIYGLVQ